MNHNEEHAEIVIQRGDNYQYIGSYKRDEILIDSGKPRGKKASYIRVKHKCGNEYDIRLAAFKKGYSCRNCCEYDKSLAYYIEVQLNLRLEDV